ncbi:MAG: GAF domain-containing sensor histidine kinase [Anaerolineae bacterium]|nr:GAF domain-containing sensor histidine kinase [Anaerolineae bacterium]
MDSIQSLREEIAERKRVQEELEQRNKELSALLVISRSVNSTLQLRPLLNLILDKLKSAVGYTGAGIFMVQDGKPKLFEFRGQLDGERINYSPHPLEQCGVIDEVMITLEPVIVDDMQSDTEQARSFQAVLAEHGLTKQFDYIRSFIGLPLMVRERLTGVLCLVHQQPGFFTYQNLGLAVAIASQAAVGIENAQTYLRAQSYAALEERQRLARELHDSVSQALYGIALGARTARELLDRDPKRLVDPLNYVLQLAEAGLTEMRSLIFELRPESLEREGLIALLRKQAEAMRVRHRMVVEFDVERCDENRLTVEQKMALHRIAQEALHNIIKHAKANKVIIAVETQKQSIVLTITDNGVGFDPKGNFPGHLGLQSMNERAEELFGTTTLESTPGVGTTVKVTVPLY